MINSDNKYQTTEELHRRIDYWRNHEAHLVDRMNRYGPDFWHHKVNGARIRLRNLEAEIARRGESARPEAISPKKQKRFYIRIQQRSSYNGKFPPDNWRAYRRYSAWPITFPTVAAAEEFMRTTFTFKNINGRKVSASVEQCR